MSAPKPMGGGAWVLIRQRAENAEARLELLRALLAESYAGSLSAQDRLRVWARGGREPW